jgi:uncharacterized protein YxjI
LRSLNSFDAKPASHGGQVAQVGKKWFGLRDTYGEGVAPGQREALVLAVAILVDEVSHPLR